ncbi:MAG: hypothetical protein NVSMB65_21030 [Chloroflexota bacterium]
MVSARREGEGRRDWVGSESTAQDVVLPSQELVGVINGFVHLAGARYRRAGLVGEAIRVYLHQVDDRPVIHIADYGPGLSGPDLHRLARRLQAEVSPTGSAGLRGEMVPHFGAVAEHCEVISLASGSTTPWRLTMTRGFSHYTARADSTALRVLDGTDAYLRGIDAELHAGLSVHTLADALQPGNHGALLEGAYTVQVCGDGAAVWISPFRAGGVPLMLPPVSTPWGPVHLALSAHETAQAPGPPIILRGERQLLVLGDLRTVPGLDEPPWTDGRLSGEVTYPCLWRNPLQSNVPAMKARVAALVEAVQSVQPQIQRDLDAQAAAYALSLAPPVELDQVGEGEQEQERGAWDVLRTGLTRLFRLGGRS